MVFSFGWRTAALLSGLVILAVVVPLSCLIRPSPESMGLLPDGDQEPLPVAAPVATHRTSGATDSTAPAASGTAVRYTVSDVDFTATEAMRTPAFWLLILATGLRNTVHSGMSFLMAPVVVWFLQGGGRSAEESLPWAAFFVGLLSLGTFIGTPIVGWLGGRMSQPRLSALCMAIGALAMLLFLPQSGRLWYLGVSVLLLAVAESSNPLTWSIMGDFFGRRSFATLRGWQHLPDQLMSMSTPVWMGWIFDRTGSYYWSLLPLALLYGLSACVYWTLPKPTRPHRRVEL
jgi:predicted MFS family arabinose efflux permease